MTTKPVWAALAALTVTLVLGGCSAPAAREPHTGSMAEGAKKQLGRLPGVDSVRASQQHLDGTEDIPEHDRTIGADVNRWDADLWKVDILVTMATTATADETALVAQDELAFSQKYAKKGEWQARLAVSAAEQPQDADLGQTDAIGLDVFPVTARSAVETVRDLFAIKSLPGVGSVDVFRGQATLTVVDAASLDAVYDAAQHSKAFAKGGSYWAEEGRLRIADLPGRLSDAAVHAVIDLAVRYPHADVAIETPLDGQRWPQLFLNHVSTAEGAEITATLTAPAMAAANTDTWILPFHMLESGPDGDSDVSGTLGNVTPLS